MRIIGGKFRSMKLVVHQGNTRPSSDRLKESLFNVLGQTCHGQVWLDLFGGSGAIALEAISRMASYAVINDADPMAVATIKQNVAKLKVESFVQVLNMDAASAIEFLDDLKKQFDVIFLDPPYDMDIQPIIDRMINTSLIKPTTQIIIEQTIRDNEYHLSFGFDKIKERAVGRSIYRIYQKGE